MCVCVFMNTHSVHCSDRALSCRTVYLEEGVELRFALVEEFLVDGFEGKFAEGWQLQFLQRRKTLRRTREREDQRLGSEH